MAIEPDVHMQPAWREKGDTALLVRLEFKEREDFHRVEELWCKQLDADRFEICCIPFFAYNLALGDQVIAEPGNDGSFTITRVAKPSKRYTFRTWFLQSPCEAICDELIREMEFSGCLFELYAENRVAIDASSTEQANAVYEILERRRRSGQLDFEKSCGESQLDVKVHQNPVWRDKADYIIQAKVEHSGSREIREQLWARQLAESRFEICCIPFFVFNLALGDEVETGTNGNQNILQQVVKQSGHRTFWLWFMESSDGAVRRGVQEKLTRLGFLTEWYSKELLAVDAESDAQQASLIDSVREESAQGYVECVPGHNR